MAIYQGHIALDGSTRITCTASSMTINKIIINNTDSNYEINVSRFMTGPGIHEIPLYNFSLDLGDVLIDSDEYKLLQSNYIEFKTDVEGTTYYVSTIE